MPRGPASKPSQGRQRLIEAASETLARRGWRGATVADVLDLAETPAGVLYHHFPSGKDALMSAAIEHVGRAMAMELDAALQAASDWRSGVASLFEAWARRLEASDYTTGCPVTATVADDAGADLTPVCAQAYLSWVERLEQELAREGAVNARSRALAIVAAFEGALLLSKALRTTEPISSVTQSFVHPD